MAIDGITLLTMIRDGKIKKETLIEVSGGIHSHLPYVIFGENKRLYWAHAKKNIQGVVLSNEFFEYTFEIIEEKPKKIEEYKQNINLASSTNQEQAVKIFKYLCDFAEKINELIKATNYLLEKSDSE